MQRDIVYMYKSHVHCHNFIGHTSRTDWPGSKRCTNRPSDRVKKKNRKLCGNFRQNYAEESDDYAEISKINKVVPLAFSNV